MRRMGLLLVIVILTLSCWRAPVSVAQSNPVQVDFRTIIRSTVSIFVGQNCAFDGATRRNPLGVPTFQAISSTCPSGWVGSGTIIQPDGEFKILTNAHVALDGITEDSKPIWVMVSLTVDAREEPTPAFFARAETFDSLLDLAVVRPEYDLDGSPLSEEALAEIGMYAMPIAEDPVDIGQEILNIGYPGIGGDLITVTSGRVSGFQADLNNPELRNEGWIKTDATLGGGISGGSTINLDGELVGVPTRIGDIEIREMSSGNGVPVGQINYIRPISVGLPELMRRAELNDQPVLDRFVLDGEQGTIAEGPATSNARPQPNQIPQAAESVGETPADAAPAEQSDASGNESEPESPTVRQLVEVSGIVVSAQTGEPIDGAFFAVLKPGVTFQQWLASDLDAAMVLTVGETDADGAFTLIDPVEAGATYAYVVIADGYGFVWGDEFVLAPKGSDESIELAPIQLRELAD